MRYARSSPRCWTAPADWAAWQAAGLTALPLPEEHGGDGLGLEAVAVLLRESGQRAQRVPAWETLCCSALTLAAHGTEAQRKEHLTAIAEGTVLTAGARGRAGHGRRRTPSGRLTGRKVAVTYADTAAALLVVARDGDAEVVALVDPQGEGVTLLPASSSAGTPTFSVVLDDAPAELLDGDAAPYLRAVAAAGLAVTAAGVLAGARDLTADYVKGREQFGRALAEFQAVSLQMADVYVASRTLDLAADNAVWRVANGLPAADDLAVAGYWVSRVAPAAFRTCHHLHGGMGVDVTYPLIGYTSWGTDLAHALDTLPAAGAGRGPGGQEPRAQRRAARPQGRAARVVRAAGRGVRAPGRSGCRRGRLGPARAVVRATDQADGRRRLDGRRLARRSTAGTASARSSRPSSPTRRSTTTCTCRPSPCRPSGRR